MQAVITTAALIVIGIVIINGIYEGSVVEFVDDESLGNMTANITSFTVANPSISQHADHAPTCTNQTTALTLAASLPCNAPCFIVSYANGNLTANETRAAAANPNEDVIVCDYYNTKLPGGSGTSSALGTGVLSSGYLWVAIGFLGLGLLVMGAVFILRIIRQLE